MHAAIFRFFFYFSA
ncbi:pheST operon leader peptide PheM [Erwinia sp. S63]|nr:MULTISPECIES: pheST operon leader peptide PheM [Enterobacterales]MBK4771405.1 pheST operon leader peptide PheM [Pantoea sp. Morm]MDF7628422.1 pheST operon leader peptide PheM [Erwiniaceae bacterium L1_55_4]MDF7650165.1 pheST operon leader peptide PheM [Erwiniaceae bacterium L1_54_3]MDF7657914.1 pheST operon leader peptide PheM [Erwiniaceae bacterium L1_54_6]MDI6931527.1 pheST operon leader peptide PheM [Serratia sp. Se-PFBMAAmG]MDN5471785.1 pheST operon leader peptide PheM [Enterobacterale